MWGNIFTKFSSNFTSLAKIHINDLDNVFLIFALSLSTSYWRSFDLFVVLIIWLVRWVPTHKIWAWLPIYVNTPSLLSLIRPHCHNPSSHSALTIFQLLCRPCLWLMRWIASPIDVGMDARQRRCATTYLLMMTSLSLSSPQFVLPSVISASSSAFRFWRP